MTSPTLSDLIVKCLSDKGELGGREIAQILNIPQKAVNVSLGHLRRKGIIERGTPLTPIYKTPYGTYQSHYQPPTKWKLKEVVE